MQPKNIQTVLQEIAYQARCALWLKDDKFYIKYLALEPSIDETITVSDIEANSLVLTHTPTEDLITKYVAAWSEDYAVTEKNQLILRYNVAKYGLHEQTFDYYIYNIADLVRKSATFWLIRRANTWRKVLCKTPLSKLKVEVFDTMGVTLPDFADGEIKAVVEKANYNSDDHTIDFELWTPVPELFGLTNGRPRNRSRTPALLSRGSEKPRCPMLRPIARAARLLYPGHYEPLRRVIQPDRRTKFRVFLTFSIPDP